jgi:hypothetical protein
MLPMGSEAGRHLEREAFARDDIDDRQEPKLLSAIAHQGIGRGRPSSNDN